MTDLVALVPVRGGSKGLPGKNLRPLAGVPLWQRAVAQGRAAGARVIVTTDVEDILDAPAGEGVTHLRRPADLAQDDTPMAPVVLHALETLGAARCVLLQPTSPLRRVEDIEAAVSIHRSGAFDLVMSVTQADSGVLKYGMRDGDRFVPLSDPAYPFANRQSLPEVLRPNGAVYVFGRDWFVGNGGFVTERIGAHVMPDARSRDIDTAADFDAAETWLAAQSSS